MAKEKQEVWKPIPGYENYEASTLGKIRRLFDSVKFKNLKAGDECTYTLHPKGYFIICLQNKKNKKTQNLHRWIAQTFIPNPQNLPQVDHINEIKSDNRICNLRWTTVSYNIRRSKSIPLKAINLDTGEEKIFLNSKDASDYTGADKKKINLVYDKKRPHTKRWYFEKIDLDPKILIDEI